VEGIGPVGPEGGRADVPIDSILMGRMDSIASKRKNRQVLLRSGRLYGGRHELKVIKAGGQTIELAAVRIVR